MRIALAAEGTRGDVHPLIGLGSLLAQAGHEAVVCAPPDFREDAESVGLGFRPIGLPIRERLGAEAAAFGGGNLRVLGAARRWLRESVPAQLARTPEATADADCIVAGGVQVAAASAAELHGVPDRYVAYCPLLFPSPDHPPFVIPRQDLGERWNRWLWRVLAPLQNRPIGARLARARAAWGLPPLRDVHAHLLGRRPLLAADAELAPAPRSPGVEILQVPCLHRPQLHRPEDEALPAKLRAFLEAGPPPVSVGFGSMAAPDPAATTRAVLEAVARLGCRALLSEGWAGLGDLPLPGEVMRIGPVDHAALFPRLAALVHHGGAGTTTLAARSGVPQLVVPHLLDQYYWGERVRALGIGPPPLARRRLGADTLAGTLDAVLGNEILEARAREVGERLRAGVDLARALEAVLAEPA